MTKIKKLIFGALIVAIALYAAGMVRVMFAHNDYQNPEYQAYKAEYIQCAGLQNKDETADKVIYQLWESGEKVACKQPVIER